MLFTHPMLVSNRPKPPPRLFNSPALAMRGGTRVGMRPYATADAGAILCAATTANVTSKRLP